MLRKVIMMNLYYSGNVSDIKGKVLEMIDEWIEMVGFEKFNYMIDNPNNGRYKKWSLLNWKKGKEKIKNKMIENEYDLIGLMLTSGRNTEEYGDFHLTMTGDDFFEEHVKNVYGQNRGAVISINFTIDFFIQNQEKILLLFKKYLVNIGFAYFDINPCFWLFDEIDPSLNNNNNYEYEKIKTNNQIYSLNISTDPDYIKNISHITWAVYLNPAKLEELGGIDLVESQLKKEFITERIRDGLYIQMSDKIYTEDSQEAIEKYKKLGAVIGKLIIKKMNLWYYNTSYIHKNDTMDWTKRFIKE